MLAGFRSRWTIPFSCAASSASAIWRAIVSASDDRQGPALEALRERRALDQLEDQRGDAVGLLQSVDRPDVGMIQRREKAGFARETGATLRIGREV